ncbi:MAG: hypothetical protein CL866_08285 [Cycloclasticus sp.]|nr:hypothetical protein [Cycloclasticus sp.]
MWSKTALAKPLFSNLLFIILQSLQPPNQPPPAFENKNEFRNVKFSLILLLPELGVFEPAEYTPILKPSI